MQFSRKCLLVGIVLCLSGCGNGVSEVPLASPLPTPSQVGTSREAKKQTSVASREPTSLRSSSSPSSITLRVVPKQPIFGDNTPEHFRYPQSVTVPFHPPWTNHLEAVGADGWIILAPQGWQTYAIIAANGSRTVTLFAPGGSQASGPHLTVYSTTSSGGAWYGAAPYFQWVRDHFRQSGWPPYTGSIIKGDQPAANLRFFQAPNTPNGLQVNGIAYAPFVGQLHHPLLFRKAETALPVEEHGLATILLNWLLPQITK